MVVGPPSRKGSECQDAAGGIGGVCRPVLRAFCPEMGRTNPVRILCREREECAADHRGTDARASRGWGNYFWTGNADREFNNMDYFREIPGASHTNNIIVKPCAENRMQGLKGQIRNGLA